MNKQTYVGATPQARDQNEVTTKAMPQSKYIECVKCGKRFRSLKCHLARKHGWYEYDYRKFTGLADDIPLVCGELSERRREIIKKTNEAQRFRAKVPSR